MKKADDRIIRRVRRLLALAEDNSNMNESHLAFLNAQKMMVEYGIDPSEIDASEEVKEVLTKSATEYKKLWWWERSLAAVISKNFRCKYYLNSKRLDGRKQVSRKIVFVGFEKDVALATEMYSLVIEATTFYANRFIKKKGIQGNRGETIDAKNDFIRGFIDGLERKFEEQISEQEWGLVVVVPPEVIEKQMEITKGGKRLSWFIPSTQSHENYETGFKEGNAIDYTKSTIDDEVIK